MANFRTTVWPMAELEYYKCQEQNMVVGINRILHMSGTEYICLQDWNITHVRNRIWLFAGLEYYKCQEQNMVLGWTRIFQMSGTEYGKWQD